MKKEKASPACFALIKGEWTPTEFYEGPDIWGELKSEPNFEQWTNEIGQIIQGEERTYGLILRLTKGNDMEETDEKTRTQFIEPKQKKVYQGDVITKYWAEEDAESWCCTSNCYDYPD